MVVLSWLVSAVARSAGDTTRLGLAARTGEHHRGREPASGTPGLCRTPGERPGPLPFGELCFHGRVRGRQAGRRAGMPGTARRTGGRAGSSYQRANAAVVIQMAA